MRRDDLYLTDIVDAIDSIERFLIGVDEAAFLSDELRQSAVLQKLSVIGEAAARLSPELKVAAAGVPWSSIVGFRNIAIHAYFNVDWLIVWTTAKHDLLDLKLKVHALIDSSSED